MGSGASKDTGKEPGKDPAKEPGKDPGKDPGNVTVPEVAPPAKPNMAQLLVLWTSLDLGHLELASSRCK